MPSQFLESLVQVILYPNSWTETLIAVIEHIVVLLHFSLN